MTYSELKTNVAGYFNRGDLADKVDGWIDRAEAFMFREISPHTIEATDTGTTTGTIALPADYSKLIRLDVDYYGSVCTLDYTTQGNGFVIEGETIRLLNEPEGSYSYTLYYAPKLTALSEANTTNWLLENGYDLYFYASVLEGAKALKNANEIGVVSSILPLVLESVKGYAMRSKIPSSGSLQIKLRRAV
jgi:hypothetical protein